MQTLWSRVAQVRATCRCPQCLNAANGVTRRATASATRRMPRYLYSSTLWYSGIFAAAATFDASRKERRKEQWDRVIAEVRQELEQPSTKGSYKDFEDKAETLEPATNAVHSEAEVCEPFQGILGENASVAGTIHKCDDLATDRLPGQSTPEDDIFHLVEPERYKPFLPTNTAPELGELDWAPQSIYASDDAKQTAERTRWSPKKLAAVHKCTEILQLQFLQALSRSGLSEEAAAAVPDEYAEYILLPPNSIGHALGVKLFELKEIQAADAYLSDYRPRKQPESLELCQYTQDSLGNFHDTAREVNRSMRALFKQRMSDPGMTQAALLAKLAYTLYVSPAPPNLATFNTLLIGLRRFNEEGLARKVIITMHESHMRANEISFATTLNFYTEVNDMDNFVRTIERIRGKHGGSMLARPNVRIESESARRKLLRVDVNGRRGHEQRVIQLPTPTPMVFRAIVSGILKFAGFDAALSICEGMSKEGWGLCMAGLTPLLTDCADRGDWKSGLAVWRQIQLLKTKSDNQPRVVREWIGIEAFAAMLRLCTKCDQREVFDTVWRQVSNSSGYSMARLTRMIKDEAQSQSTTPVQPPVAPAVHVSRPSQAATEPLDESSHDDLDTQYWRDYASNMSVVHATSQEDQPVQHASLLPPTQSRLDKSPKKPAPPGRPNTLLEQQLLGLHPAGHELDDYELRERPTSAHA